ncbi:MAG: 1-deoxy-D-xylulose-5-phosphate reductoisomerase, partial [Planctomycetota bacterium]|nr:1-deoxy-D-xylulose-5-phosphate reductoisomerase [Planctomycetota bacterium]
MSAKRVAILGSTGSIGRQALAVIAQQPRLGVCALAAGHNVEALAEQIERFAPEFAAVADERKAQALAGRFPGVRVFSGSGAMSDLVRASRPDVLLTAVVGSAGLAPTLAGIECGSDLAIANKETLVMAGSVVMAAARAAGVAVLPVDSEHSAIFQCLACGRGEEVRRVVITGSGGALRDHDDHKAHHASVADALAHPTWDMGRKITIDSATMINKALEIVEAHWLFGLPADKIDVVMHPE